MTDLEKVLGKTGARKFWDKVWGNVKILTGDVAYNTKGDLQTQINAVADTASTAKTTADAAKTAAEDAKVAAGEIVTDTTDKFDSTKDYAVGDYVIYDNKAWKFTTVHPAGAWDESHVEQTNILAEIAAQNKNFAELTAKILSYDELARWTSTTQSIETTHRISNYKIFLLIFEQSSINRSQVRSLGSNIITIEQVVNSDGIYNNLITHVDNSGTYNTGFYYIDDTHISGISSENTVESRLSGVLYGLR